MKTPHILADFLALTSLTSGIAAWQEQLDWGLRIIAAVVAITAGSVAIYQRLKPAPKNRFD